MLHNYKCSFFSNLLILLFCTFNIYAQLEGELIPFQQTYPGPNDPSVIRGDMKVIGNSILGIQDTVEDESGSNREYTPNESYFGESRNNGVYRGYIDIDSDSGFNGIFNPALPNSERNYSGSTNIYGSPTNSTLTDSGTFSSSTAELSINNPLSPAGENCSTVVKAFLYWGAMYGIESNTYLSDNRDDGPDIERPDCTRPDGSACEMYTDIKILPPGATEYVEIKYTNTGEDYTSLKSNVIIDGVAGRTYSFSAIDEVRDETYACVADVTSLFTHLQNNGEAVEGNWTVANVRALTGIKSSGSGGGWSLVVVYEDPLATFQKNISMFEGYAAITRPSDNDSASVEFNISGFETVSYGPVNVDIATIALEGDIGIYGDQLQINEENEDPTKSNNWIPLYYPESDPENFYDSSIYSKGPVTRFPNSSNTLGYDSDHFQLANPSNIYVSNGDNEVDFRIYTEGDAFANFFNAFAIEVSTPKLQVFNKVYKIDGSEFAESEEVDLGDEIEYEITITNNGNDNIATTIFTDILPPNTFFNDTEITLNGSVIPNSDIAIIDTIVNNSLTGLAYETKQISFDIADELLPIGESVVIRFKVEVVSDCSLLQNACTNRIENQALVSYSGSLSSNNQNYETLSYYDTDTCGQPIIGPTTLLIDTTVCENYAESISICAPITTLEGGKGFSEYRWFYEGTRLTTNADGSSIGYNDNSININQSGTYTVDQIKSTSIDYSPCRDQLLTFNVEIYDPLDPPANPFENFGEALDPVCADDGTMITEIQLCNNTIEIPTDFPNGTYYSWQKYDETLDCSQNNENCPYYSISVANCYIEISNTDNFYLSEVGAYKLSVTVTGGCQFEYYFDAVENCTTLSTTSNQILNDKISIYPSPVVNNLYISGQDLTSFKDIKIVNLKGEILIQNTELTNEMSIDLSNIKAGIYLVVLENNSGILTEKILKK